MVRGLISELMKLADRSATASRWVSTSAGAHLAGRVTRNTRPEIELRRAVHALGFRFRLHRAVLPRCTPDFVLPRWRVAVFVDGCFWHGCPEHASARFNGPNAQRWQLKIKANKERDTRNNKALTLEGWKVIRIWECEVRRDVTVAATRIAHLARTPTA